MNVALEALPALDPSGRNFKPALKFIVVGQTLGQAAAVCQG